MINLRRLHALRHVLVAAGRGIVPHNARITPANIVVIMLLGAGCYRTHDGLTNNNVRSNRVPNQDGRLEASRILSLCYDVNTLS